MTDDQVLRVKAVFFTVLAITAGGIFLYLPWAPKIDFDITGFLFVLGNLPRITAFIAFLTFGGAAATFWTRLRQG